MRKCYALLPVFLLALQLHAQCNQPLYIAFMTHLEDDWRDDRNPILFARHKNGIMLEMSFFKPYGARVNFESAMPFLKACYNWNDNVFQTMLDSSMGVGGHSNVSDLYDTIHNLVRGLIGNNQQYLGTSGGISNDTTRINNWVDSAVQAGYNYVNGIVYSAWLQVPRAHRPHQETDQEILDRFHDPVFSDLSENIFPRRIRSAFTFYADSTGPLVLISGSAGPFQSLVEGASYCLTHPCQLDSSDVDTFLARVNRAVEILKAHPGKIACVYMHVQLNIIKPQNKVFFDYLFNSLKPLQQAGKIQYATMAEIYQAFINCEQTAAGTKHEGPSAFAVYPNPSAGKFIIKSGNNAGFRYTVRDIYGRSITSGQSNANRVTINLRGFPDGIYRAEISSGKYTRTFKLVKNR